MSKGAYDFKAKTAQYRKYDDASLAYAAKDIREAIAAWPDGPNANWYADDLHTVAGEIARRAARSAPACPACGK